MISLYIHHDSSEGEQWGRDEIYPENIISYHLFNIAMGNGPFIEVYLLKMVIFHGKLLIYPDPMVVYRGNHHPPESQEARSVRPRCAWDLSHPRGPKTTSSGQSSVPRNETRRTKKCHLCHLWNKTFEDFYWWIWWWILRDLVPVNHIYIYIINFNYLFILFYITYIYPQLQDWHFLAMLQHIAA